MKSTSLPLNEDLRTVLLFQMTAATVVAAIQVSENSTDVKLVPALLTSLFSSIQKV